MNLTKSQRIFKRQLIHEVEIYRKKRFREGSVWKEEFVFLKKIKCRLSTNTPSKTGDEVLTENQQRFLSPFTLYSLPDDIKADDRFVFYHSRGHTLYEAVSSPRNPSFLDHHYETPLEEINLTVEFVNSGTAVYMQVSS
ncbi:hypothetical protein BTO30_13490 [Domibacillus antri]|uniref:Uncharacterized protein n=1 Tax=Domibacillus antri TaxID=1714264 RepID=A0A1Q8Q356_9BACI|nr:hypothetical protein [Domibacillus antri]OLN21711.1 hypothetical protein BTO30_13490 [Domibacillus antri]